MTRITRGAHDAALSGEVERRGGAETFWGRVSPKTYFLILNVSTGNASHLWLIPRLASRLRGSDSLWRRDAERPQQVWLLKFVVGPHLTHLSAILAHVGLASHYGPDVVVQAPVTALKSDLSRGSWLGNTWFTKGHTTRVRLTDVDM
ncbi:hypothetical protein EYF80_043021 [Liparis tanakae]|uniref:Uncharacterized protein n=1 Tax=Liparis tanakae TaxID=230148 RepID=A0A4Z2FZT7_9TELE|nr:hypothetical protein EYF80_043021 [Liparis tanakae]